MVKLVERERLLKRIEDGRWETSKSHFHKGLLKIVTGTTSATAGTQTSHAHGLGIAPDVNHIMILSKGAGVVYLSALPTDTYIFVKSTGSSIDFAAWIIYEE